MSKELQREKDRLNKIIRPEIAKIVKDDPKFLERVRINALKQKKRADLEILNATNKVLDDNIKMAIENTKIELFNSVPEEIKNSDEFSRLDDLISQFNAPKIKSAPLIDLPKVDMESSCNLLANNLSKLKNTASGSIDTIQNEVSKLSKELEDKMTEELKTYVNEKMEQAVEDKMAELEEIAEDPLKFISETVLDTAVEQARRGDRLESSAMDTMLKVANFIETGEYDTSFSQKASIFFKNFDISKPGSFDPAKLLEQPQNLETLCKDINNELTSGKGGKESIDKTSKLIQTYLKSEQERVKTGINAINGAIKARKEKDGDEAVSNLLNDLGKQIEKPFVKAHKVAKGIASADETGRKAFVSGLEKVQKVQSTGARAGDTIKEKTTAPRPPKKSK